jgi:hypothetical protein
MVKWSTYIGSYSQYKHESDIPLSFEDIKIETQKGGILKIVYSYVMYGWAEGKHILLMKLYLS